MLCVEILDSVDNMMKESLSSKKKSFNNKKTLQINLFIDVRDRE